MSSSSGPAVHVTRTVSRVEYFEMAHLVLSKNQKLQESRRERVQMIALIQAADQLRDAQLAVSQAPDSAILAEKLGHAVSSYDFLRSIFCIRELDQ